jgi:Uncharacterised nucleotidyltransferase
LLLCAVGMAPARVKEEALPRLIDRGIDWIGLLRRARRHGVASLLSESLRSHVGDRVPPHAKSWLDRYRNDTASRSLYLTGQLTRILDRLAAEGVTAVPFKGPTLAALAYGNLGLREYLDLDILVRRDDVGRATAVLSSLAFRPRIEVSADRQGAFLESENALSFRREADGCIVELHWSLTPKYLPFDDQSDDVWSTRIEVRLAGLPIPTLGVERLLLYLCVHGAKHFWERLNWICDVARLVEGPVPIQWEQLLADSDRSGSRRMLFVALLLARDLLGASLPPVPAAAVGQDASAAAIAAELGRCLLTDSHRTMSNHRRLVLHLRMRERLRDRVRYGAHMALTPSVKDYETFRLPRYLTLLYRPLRPLRLLYQYAGHRDRP